MEEAFESQEPSDDFRNLPFDEIRAIRTNYKEIKSITHQNSFSRWYNLEGSLLKDSFYMVSGLSCDSRSLLVVLNYDADNDSYVYHHISLADGDEFKRFWCS